MERWLPPKPPGRGVGGALPWCVGASLSAGESQHNMGGSGAMEGRALQAPGRCRLVRPRPHSPTQVPNQPPFVAPRLVQVGEAVAGPCGLALVEQRRSPDSRRHSWRRFVRPPASSASAMQPGLVHHDEKEACGRWPGIYPLGIGPHHLVASTIAASVLATVAMGTFTMQCAPACSLTRGLRSPRPPRSRSHKLLSPVHSLLVTCSCSTECPLEAATQASWSTHIQ